MQLGPTICWSWSIACVFIEDELPGRLQYPALCMSQDNKKSFNVPLLKDRRLSSFNVRILISKIALGRMRLARTLRGESTWQHPPHHQEQPTTRSIQRTKLSPTTQTSPSLSSQSHSFGAIKPPTSTHFQLGSIRSHVNIVLEAILYHQYTRSAFPTLALSLRS